MLKKYGFCIILAALIAALSGCSGEGEGKSVAVERKEEERTPVTMLYTVPLSDFEALVEKTWPDIDLQVEVNAEATIDGESERRLYNGHGTDIVASTMPTGNVRAYVADLSAEPYIDRYQTAAFQNVSEDGKTLFIPLPGQYYGYIYNKTLAERGNIPAAKTQMEILDMLDAAAEQGLGVGEDGVLFGVTSAMATVSSWMMATQVPDFLGKASGIVWNQKLLDGEAGFVDGMGHCLDMISLLTERGYLNAESLYLSPQMKISYNGNAIPLEKRMLEGSLMMMYGTTRFLTFLNQNSSEYEYAMLPFMGNEGNHPWTITAPDAYLSLNAKLDEPGEEALRDACSRVLDLLSTPEGQKAYIEDCGAGRSYLNSYDSIQGEIPEGLRGCIEGGYIYNIQLPSRVMNYFGKQMVSVLNGEKEMYEALAEVDDYYRNGSDEVDYDQTLIGLAGEDMLYENYNVRLAESGLGNLVADAVREQTGTQIAFVNGGSIRGSLYAGNVYGGDLDIVCPYDNHLVTLEVDGATIRAMLENGISTRTQLNGIPGGRFLNVSGLCYSFRPEEGDTPAQLLEVTLSDGTPIKDRRRYTVTVTNYMAGSSGYLDNNGDGYTMINLYSSDVPLAENVKLLKATEDTYADALQNYFAGHEGEAIVSRCEGRIKVVTGHD